MEILLQLQISIFISTHFLIATMMMFKKKIKIKSGIIISVENATNPHSQSLKSVKPPLIKWFIFHLCVTYILRLFFLLLLFSCVYQTAN